MKVFATGDASSLSVPMILTNLMNAILWVSYGFFGLNDVRDGVNHDSITNFTASFTINHFFICCFFILIFIFIIFNFIFMFLYFYIFIKFFSLFYLSPSFSLSYGYPMQSVRHYQFFNWPSRFFIVLYLPRIRFRINVSGRTISSQIF